jgi:MFS transporter, SP family, sugar:H+ symporter
MNESYSGPVVKPPPVPGVEPPTSHVFVLLVSAVAAIGGFLFGFDSGVINGAVDALAVAFNIQSQNLSTGFAVASVLLGCAVGAFLAGNISDFLGRRPTMLLTAVIFLVSAYATGAAQSVDVFIAARVLGGLAIGGASVIAPMYISEVSPAALRGRLASLQQLAIVLGLFGAVLSNYVLDRAAGGASGILWLGEPAWRWMFWMEALPSVAFFIGAMLIPESPRYLVAHGQHAFARAIFARIGGDPDCLVREVQQSLLGEHRPRLSDLIDAKTRRIAPILWSGMGLAAFQQFVGINIIFYYGAVLWQAAGSSAHAALRNSLITNFTNIIATIVAIALIDRLGRKPLLVIGSIGMAVTLGILSAVFATAGLGPDGKPLLTHTMGLIGLGAANLYVVAFGISWGPVMWVLLGEMFPNRLRGAALAVSGATNWVANFAITASFPVMLSHIGLGGTYGLYTIAAFISLFFVLKFVRETKGRTLEQM